MTKSKTALLIFLTGAFLTLSFPPIPFSLLAFVAFVPLLFVLDSNPKRPYLLIYLTFFIYHGGANHWISSWQSETDPFLLISGLAVWLIHPLFFLFPFFIYRTIQKKFSKESAIWALPFIWVCFEWFHSFGEFSYPWLSVGYSQVKNTFWVQPADLGGVYLISFLIVLFNVIVFRIITHIKSLEISSLKDIKIISDLFIRKHLIIALGIIILPVIYSVTVLQSYHHGNLMKNNPKIQIGLVQPNINPWRKWETNAISQILVHQRIQDSLNNLYPNTNLYIWSETAITLLSLDINSKHEFSFLQESLDATNSSLLTGFADIYFYKSNEPHLTTSKINRLVPGSYYDSYNSAILLSPSVNKTPVQIYHKMKLTPFGERIPYIQFYTFALKWLEWGVGISSWALGSEQKALDIKTQNYNTKVGSIICIESIYPGFVANFVDLGAEFLAVITNDAWYDHTMGPEQHFQISAMRAIETKRYIARCANTGVTGFLMPDGKEMIRAEQYQGTGIVSSIPLIKNKTFYVQNGDWFPLLSSIITFAAFLYSVIKKKFF